MPGNATIFQYGMNWSQIKNAASNDRSAVESPVNIPNGFTNFLTNITNLKIPGLYFIKDKKILSSILKPNLGTITVPKSGLSIFLSFMK